MSDDNAGTNEIVIEFVEEPIKVRANMGLLTWGDLLTLQRISTSDASEDDKAKILSDVVSRVTGLDAQTMPAMAVIKLIPMIMERAQGITPKN